MRVPYAHVCKHTQCIVLYTLCTYTLYLCTQFVIRIRQFMRSTKRTACGVEVRYQPISTYMCVGCEVCVFWCAGKHTYILSASPPTYWLVVIIMTSRLRLYYLPACSFELSSTAIWCIGSIYTSSTSHHHQLCSIRAGETAKATQRTGWWCVLVRCDTEWYDMVGYAIQYHRTQHTSAKMCSVWYKRCDYVSMS